MLTYIISAPFSRIKTFYFYNLFRLMFKNTKKHILVTLFGHICRKSFVTTVIFSKNNYSLFFCICSRHGHALTLFLYTPTPWYPKYCSISASIVSMVKGCSFVSNVRMRFIFGMIPFEMYR